MGVVSNPLGALLAGILMDLVGRNTTVKLSSLPYLAGWALIAMAQKGNIIPVYVGRLLTGLAIGKCLELWKKILKKWKKNIFEISNFTTNMKEKL